MRKKETLPVLTTWKDLDDTMLSEMPEEKKTLCDITYMGNLCKIKVLENRAD